MSVSLFAGSLAAAATCGSSRGDLGSGQSTPVPMAARTVPINNSGGQGALDLQNMVEVYYEPLYRFAMSLAHTEHNAADLVQDTFLTLATKGHQLLDRSKAKAWLFTTLHRRFLEGQRRTTRFPHFELTAMEAELPNCEPELANRLDASAAVELLGQVDSQFRGAVALFYLEDYSYQEIASILEVPLGTVKSRIARGLAQLKRLVLKRPATTKTQEEPL